MEKKLSAKGLTISFRTSNGKVQAVRNIDFDLEAGETLAIVGESGSGKSVTAKSILGILAGNAIVEGGEIIYDGKDLLKISEEDFHKIRGDKIAMIFQDPLSSLDPIVKIGNQMTEAMLLKNKAIRKNSRKNFNSTLKLLNTNMNDALGASASKEAIAENDRLCKILNEFSYVQLELELDFNTAHQACEDGIVEIDNDLFEIEKEAFERNAAQQIRDIVNFSKASISRFVVRNDAEEIKSLASELQAEGKKAIKQKNFASLVPIIKRIREIMASALERDVPDFSALGYYLKFVNSEIPEMPISNLNALTKKALDDGFMNEFLATARNAISYSNFRKVEAMKSALEVLSVQSAEFDDSDVIDTKKLHAAAKAASAAVNSCINKLEIVKDSKLYTFDSSFHSTVQRILKSPAKNKKETKRFDKQTRKLEALAAKGKQPDWKVVPIDLENIPELKKRARDQIVAMQEHLRNLIATADMMDVNETTDSVVDYLKKQASNVVYKVTPTMAKNRAIKLMEEVGIPEPRVRFKQYPFEFSGGMRQRIVIAIALSANPDILICDEPTTALDVTIQAQILELINEIKAERKLSVIFITHDLGVVANMADRVAVMYAGKIVEYGTADDIFYHPAHPYTWALLSSMPDLDTDDKLDAIPGTPPNMIYPPVGDAFAARNKYAMKIDFEEQPPMFEISKTHGAATWLLHPNAPKVDPPKLVVERIKRMNPTGGNI